MREITALDIRILMIDRGAADNFLLDAVEFDDKQIQAAVLHGIDKFNEMAPRLTSGLHTAQNFPLRASLVEHAAGILLMGGAMNQARNRLDSQTKGGAEVQDKNKSNEYIALGRLFKEGAEKTMKDWRCAQNISEGYGHVGSPYCELSW